MLGLVGSPACSPGRRPVSPPDAVDRYVLEIERDGSFALDGKKTARQDTAREFARLADMVHTSTKDAGKPLDPKRGLPDHASSSGPTTGRPSRRSVRSCVRCQATGSISMHYAEIRVPRRGRVASPSGRSDAPAGTGKRPARGDPYAADQAPRQ